MEPGRPCPECGFGTVVSLEMCEHHLYWDADASEWAGHMELCGSESISLWWECNHCLARWPLDDITETVRSLLEVKKEVENA